MSVDPLDAALAAAKAKQSPQQHERSYKDASRGIIAAKREVSYVQLALDLRRSQTAQLGRAAAHPKAKRCNSFSESGHLKCTEKRVGNHGHGMSQAEETLAADMAKFDSFLKRNDEEVQAAEEAADLQTKLRQEKALELKTQNGKLACIKSEVNKLEDALEECAVYKAFLDDLTPTKWLQELKQSRAAAKAARMEAWREDCNAVLAERSAAAEAVAVQDYAITNARSQQQFDRATVAFKAAQIRSQAACSTQEPSVPEDPAEELAEPNYFIEPATLSQELQKMSVANAELHAQLRVSRQTLFSDSASVTTAAQ